MAFVVANLARTRAFGSPLRKSIMLCLSDHADSSGANVWPSMATIADETGFGKRAVQLGMRSLVDDRLIIETGSRRVSTGAVKVFRIDLDAVSALPIVPSHKAKQGRTTFTPSDERGESGSWEGCTTFAQGVHEIHPNHPLTINKLSHHESSHQAFDFWNEFARKHGWRKAERLTANRKKALAAISPDEWERALHEAASSDWVQHQPFFSIDWLAKPDNLSKTVEGALSARHGKATAQDLIDMIDQEPVGAPSRGTIIRPPFHVFRSKESDHVA